MSKRTLNIAFEELKGVSFRARNRINRSSRKPQKKKLKKDLTFDQWNDTMEYFGWLCAYCGGLIDSKDHVVPRSQGGPTTKWNIVPACTCCNQNKKDENMEVWYRRQSFFSEERLAKIYLFMKSWR